jgi:hypothetical protein
MVGRGRLKLGLDGPAHEKFVDQSPTYFTEEFQCEGPFERPSKGDLDNYMTLHACNRFLLVSCQKPIWKEACMAFRFIHTEEVEYPRPSTTATRSENLLE